MEASTLKGITKAELAEQVERLTRELGEARAQIPAPPPIEPVAVALAGCIRQLDALRDMQRNRSNSGYASAAVDYTFDSRIGDIEGILRHLAGRYGVDLIEPKFIPCTRRHIDDESVQQAVSLLNNGNAFDRRF